MSDGERWAERRGANRCLGGCGRCLAGGHHHCGYREWRVFCATRRRRRETATTAPAARRRTRLAVGPRPPSRVWPRRAGRPSGRPAGRTDPRRLGRLADVVENESPLHRGGLGDAGDDANRVRYRLGCRRSCSQGQRPLWVGDRPFADTAGRASTRRLLTGQERSPSMVLFATAAGR